MTAALIIATGRGPHAAAFTPEKEIGTITAVERIAIVFQRAGIERIVVVCGEDKSQVEKFISHMNLEFLRGHRDDEMLANVKLGLSYLHEKCSAVLVCSVDTPMFGVETVRKLMAANKSACIPAYRGDSGQLMFLGEECFHLVKDYTGNGALPTALTESGVMVHTIPVEDQGILAEIDDDESCCQLREQHDLSELHFDLRIRLMKERLFFGPGTYQLLSLTDETGSLLDGCRLMGISYSKGRKLIAKAEQQLGYPVIESRQGGKTGGTSAVTERGRALMDTYNAFCTEARQTLGQLFDKYFVPQ